MTAEDRELMVGRDGTVMEVSGAGTVERPWTIVSVTHLDGVPARHDGTCPCGEGHGHVR